jgi:hypothetical protein
MYNSVINVVRYFVNIFEISFAVDYTHTALKYFSSLMNTVAELRKIRQELIKYLIYISLL